MKRLFPAFAAFACSWLAPELGAQKARLVQPERLQTHGTPVEVHYDLATGAVTFPKTKARLAPGSSVSSSAAPSLCFDNSVDDDCCLDALLYPPGHELYDWGIKDCNLPGRVERLRIGYASLARPTSNGGPGGAFTFRLFEGGQGFGTIGKEILSFSAQGLPSEGQTGALLIPFYLVVNLDGHAFDLPDGPIAWSFENPDGKTAPLLVDVDRALGTQNYYDLYTRGPGGKRDFQGTVSLGPGGISNDPWENTFHFQLFEGDTSPLVYRPKPYARVRSLKEAR